MLIEVFKNTHNAAAFDICSGSQLPTSPGTVHFVVSGPVLLLPPRHKDMASFSELKSLLIFLKE